MAARCFMTAAPPPPQHEGETFPLTPKEAVELGRHEGRGCHRADASPSEKEAR